jgi:tetratricopeptide (TPR) repeat protein
MAPTRDELDPEQAARPDAATPLRANARAEVIATLRRTLAASTGRSPRETAALHHELAQALLATGARDDAVAQLEKAWALDPTSMPVSRALATVSLEAARASREPARSPHVERARKLFRVLLLQRPEETGGLSRAAMYTALAELHRLQGEDAKARAMLERALESDPAHAPARDLLAALARTGGGP